MELYGFCLAFPMVFVMSMGYCLILANVVRRYRLLRKLLYLASIPFLAGFLGEVVLLAELGAAESRAIIGPAFDIANLIFFLFCTPALANVLVLPIRIPILGEWYVAGILCTVFAFGLLFLNFFHFDFMS